MSSWHRLEHWGKGLIILILVASFLWYPVPPIVRAQTENNQMINSGQINITTAQPQEDTDYPNAHGASASIRASFTVVGVTK